MRRSNENKERTYALVFEAVFRFKSSIILNPFPMHNPGRQPRSFLHGFMPFQPAKGHVFFLGLLLIAALPAAILTCAIFLPIRVVRWLNQKG